MTTRLWNAKVAVSALAVVAMVAVPHAQQPGAGQAPSPTSLTLNAPAPAAPQGPAVPAQAVPQLDPYVVGDAKPPEQPGPLVELTLERAIQIALEKNLDLQVARVAPILQDFSLKAARAAFLPTFTGSFRENHSQSPVTSTLDGATTFNISNNQTYGAGMNQTLPWFGGSLGLSFSSGRNASNNVNSTRNPLFSSGLSLSYNQPLLAGLKIDNTRNSLRTATIQRQITDISLQNSIETVKASVRTNYWALRYAIETIEIQKRALELANRQLNESKQKVEIGTVAPIDLTNFETAVASADQGLLQANINWRTAELTFKRVLVGGADDPLFHSTINPIDKPVFTTTQVDIDAAVANALQGRTDLVSARKNIQVSELNLEVNRSSALPTLSLSTGYSLSGSGGPQLKNGVVTAPGGYFDALTSLASLNTPSWNVGLNFSYQLGLVSQKTSLARAELTLDQSRMQLKSTELSVTADVTQAGLNVNNAWQQLKSSQVSRAAQERNADAAQTRFANGLATPFEVATALQSLTNARLNELNSIIRYVNAIADFDKKQRVQ